MFTMLDVQVLEEDDDVSVLDEAVSLQRAINDGLWSLQGSYGRAMMAAIEAGHCMLGERPARDYWGNLIPSRHQVVAGTKGSRDYVVDAMGDDWAEALDNA